MLSSSLALANGPTLLCSIDSRQFLIDTSSHAVYEISNNNPVKLTIIGLEDKRPSSGDSITYSLDSGDKIAVSGQGEDPNPWSIYDVNSNRSGSCNGQ